MLSFANATGNLFNRLGKLGLLAKSTYSFQQTLLQNMTNTTTGVVGQYNSESDLQALMGSNYINILTSMESAENLSQQIAQQTVNRMIFRDNPQIAQTLQQVNINVSLQQVITQMKAAGASVLRMTVTGTPSAFIGAGNGSVVVSLVRPVDGLPLENAFAENMLVTCTQDSYIGGATAFNEGFIITGTGSQTDVFAFNWPLGSNASLNTNAIDGDTSNGSGNLLNNSNFLTWTNNVPNNWTLTVGTAGTSIQENQSIVFGEGNSVQFVGDGSTHTQITQQFGNSSGTFTSLSPQTQYAHNVFIRRDGVNPAAGVLTIDIADQNGNTILDANNVPNSYTINLTGLTTNFAYYNGVFRTPLVLPTSQFLRYTLSTPLTNGRSVYLGKTALGYMNQTYTAGPYVSVFAGNIPFQQMTSNPYSPGDYANLLISNSRGAGGTLSTFQTLMAQLFPQMLSNGYLLPSSLTPTISDSLIG